MQQRTITQDDVNRAIETSRFDFGDGIIYDLCRNHPYHKNVDEIIAKVAIIGRSYSAAIERRIKCEDLSCVPCQQSNEEFYTETVGPWIRDAAIDLLLQQLPAENSDSPAISLAIHDKLTVLFKKMTHDGKRSLASKYLHFHNPDAFYLYDSNVAKAAQTVAPPLREIKSLLDTNFCDVQYEKHVRRCLWVRRHVREKFDIDLVPKKVDRLLWGIASRMPSVS